jgi:hypothetical protein
MLSGLNSINFDHDGESYSDGDSLPDQNMMRFLGGDKKGLSKRESK